MLKAFKQTFAKFERKNDRTKGLAASPASGQSVHLFFWPPVAAVSPGEASQQAAEACAQTKNLSKKLQKICIYE